MCHVRIIPLLVHTLPQGPVAELPLRVSRIEDHHASFRQAEDAVDKKREQVAAAVKEKWDSLNGKLQAPTPFALHFSLHGMQNKQQ